MNAKRTLLDDQMDPASTRPETPLSDGTSLMRVPRGPSGASPVDSAQPGNADLDYDPKGANNVTDLGGRQLAAMLVARHGGGHVGHDDGDVVDTLVAHGPNPGQSSGAYAWSVSSAPHHDGSDVSGNGGSYSFDSTDPRNRGPRLAQAAGGSSASMADVYREDSVRSVDAGYQDQSAGTQAAEGDVR